MEGLQFRNLITVIPQLQRIATYKLPSKLPTFNQFINYAKQQVRNSKKYSPYNNIKRVFTRDIAILLRAQGANPIAPANFPLLYHFIWERPNRQTDPDNISAAQKIILDTLVKVGILPNDGWDEVGAILHTPIHVKVDPITILDIYTLKTQTNPT